MKTASAHQKVSFATLLIALGIIYGDIGTSPLYVMKAIISTETSRRRWFMVEYPVFSGHWYFKQHSNTYS